MGDRDDFSPSVKEQLAKRVGYFCSFPDCGTITIGPSEEKSDGTSSIGMACHISSASPGGRRYNSAMTHEERKEITNGIWMCFKHGKLIDNDENRFTIDILKKWKEIAEGLAKFMLDTGCAYEKSLSKYRFTPLVPNHLDIDSNGNENEIIGDAIFDSCIHIAWGNEIAVGLRDFIIEYTRNAFYHGKASSVKIDIKENKIFIIDNGSYFNPRLLLQYNSRSGGVASLEFLFSRFFDKLIFGYERIGDLNILTLSIIDSAQRIFEITPCSIQMKLSDIKSGSFKINVRETCNEIFIVFPKYFTLSDVAILRKLNTCFYNEKRQLVFIIENLSEYVIDFLKHDFPGCQIIKV